jgi:hypothetical protein
MKVKIIILSLVISFLPSISFADTYIENKHGKITWRTCKLFYVYDGYAKEEIIPTIFLTSIAYVCFDWVYKCIY